MTDTPSISFSHEPNKEGSTMCDHVLKNNERKELYIYIYITNILLLLKFKKCTMLILEMCFLNYLTDIVLVNM